MEEEILVCTQQLIFSELELWRLVPKVHMLALVVKFCCFGSSVRLRQEAHRLDVVQAAWRAMTFAEEGSVAIF